MEDLTVNNADLTLKTEALFEHGAVVFGSVADFKTWLGRKNFFFDKNPPAAFLQTEDGMKFIDDRLTGIEYGDNA